jgi:hypothetical protein
MHPYSLVINQIRLPHKLDQETPLYGLPYFFKKNHANEVEINSYFIVSQGYPTYAVNKLYLERLKEKKIELHFKNIEAIQEGDSILTAEWQVFNFINTNFEFILIEEKYGARKILLGKRKDYHPML